MPIPKFPHSQNTTKSNKINKWTISPAAVHLSFASHENAEQQSPTKKKTNRSLFSSICFAPQNVCSHSLLLYILFRYNFILFWQRVSASYASAPDRQTMWSVLVRRSYDWRRASLFTDTCLSFLFWPMLIRRGGTMLYEIFEAKTFVAFAECRHLARTTTTNAMCVLARHP